MISFAQNFEDVMLNRAFKEKTDGFYVDVGAGHPTYDSVTKHFYDRGWSGINIEPHRQMYRELLRARPRDVNLACALSDMAHERRTFYEITGDAWQCSSFRLAATEIATAYGVTTTKFEIGTSTLTTICEQYASSRSIDFLKIDVEGEEYAVLKGMDFHRFKPKILVIEAMKPMTQIPSHLEWEHLVLGAGYSQLYFDGLNRFYLDLAFEHLREHFRAPPNVFDQFERFKLINLREQVAEQTGALARCEKTLAQQTAALAECEKILKSRSRLLSQLCSVTLRKLRRDQPKK